MYNELFNLTPYNTYRIAQMLNVSCSTVVTYRKRKSIDIEQFISFMRILGIDKFVSENNNFKLEIK